MTVDDLIRELSELPPIDRTLQVFIAQRVVVVQGRGVALSENIAALIRQGRER